MTNQTPPSDQNPKEDQEFEFKPLHKEEEPKPPSTTPEALAKLKEKKEYAQKNIQDWVQQHKTLSFVLAFLVVAFGMWAISAIRDENDNGDDEVSTTQIDEVPVNVIEARLGRFQDRIEAVGTLKGEAEIELRFEMDGKIQEFNIAEGDRVNRGQIIARIDDRDAKLKVNQAKNELEKMEKLYALGGVSKTKLDETRLELEVNQTQFEKTRLKATREGILGDKAAEVGEFVTPQRKIATLVAIKKVVVKVGVIEKQVDKVYPGQKILVTVDAYPGNVFEGTIESISPIITGESKTFEITAKIPNDNSLLLPGMFARAKVITFEADDAISVPNDALAKSPNGFQVFVVNKDNLAEGRDVEVGYVASELTEIKSGLNPGEVVVVQKPPELKSGSKVKIIEVQNTQ